MSLGPWEIAAILIVVFLLFGATRLPNAARSLGRSMRIFKSEMDEMKGENKGQDVEGRPAIAEGRAQQNVDYQAQPTAQNAQPAQQPVNPSQPVQQPAQQPVQQQFPEGEQR